DPPNVRTLPGAADPRPLHSFPTRRSSDLSFQRGLPVDARAVSPAPAEEPVAFAHGNRRVRPGIGIQRVPGIGSPDVRADRAPLRSEEHTSELQSLAYLVCRLLLEKKKKHR